MHSAFGPRTLAIRMGQALASPGPNGSSSCSVATGPQAAVPLAHATGPGRNGAERATGHSATAPDHTHRKRVLMEQDGRGVEPRGGLQPAPSAPSPPEPVARVHQVILPPHVVHVVYTAEGRGPRYIAERRQFSHCH